MRKISFIFISTIIAFSFLLSACGSAATPAPAPTSAPAATEASSGPTAAPTAAPLSGNISVSGAFALYPMMTVWAADFTKINPNVQFDVQGGGAGKGMTDTLSGAVDIGM